ncbi:MAG: HD domain-containing protein [Candidatus Altiarchaeota archaeon]|nr:HD domain-containing protein [Candidatus Altiarchaeota archaeon]
MTLKDKEVLNFLFETAMLRRIKHEGWRFAGVEFPDSVAEHSLRAAQIGYVLAHMEGYENPERVATMLIFHDLAESRTGDQHLIAKKYIKSDEEAALRDQVKHLGKLGENIIELWGQIERRDDMAGKIAKDADWLEQALTAKEYMEKGYKDAKIWIRNGRKLAHFKTTKRLMDKLLKMNSSDWCKDLNVAKNY